MPFGLTPGGSGAPNTAPAPQGYYDENGNWIASGQSAYGADDFSGVSGAGDAGPVVNSGWSTDPTQQSVNQDLANLNQGNAGNNSATGWDPTGGIGANGMARQPWEVPGNEASPPGMFDMGGPRVAGWMDITQPGLAETTADTVTQRLLDPNTRATAWADENPDAFAAPGQGEQYWEGVAGNFNNRPVATNMAQTAYDQYERDRPDLGPSELGTYYDFAKKRTGEDVNAQLAARGMFGSSRGVQQVSDALGGLEAERANREADYDLARSADSRAWATGRSGAAQGADASSRGVAQTDLAQTLGFGDLAMGAQNAEETRILNDLGIATGLDTQELGRLGGALNAGAVGQGARMDRIGMGYESLFGLGSAAGDTVGQSDQQMMQMLMQIEDAIQSAYLAGDTAQVAKLTQDRSNLMAETGGAVDTVGSLFAMGG